jgi:SAM-dependent methyltransferase
MTHKSHDTGSGADIRVDGLYAGLRGRYEPTNARANGYRLQAWFERERIMVLKAIGQDDETVVDIACGSGLMMAPLVAAGRSVIGIDFNADACRSARDNAVMVIRGDAYRLPFADASVTRLVNCQFFNQQPRAAVARFVGEVARVLRSDGRAVLVWRNGDAWIHRIAHSLLRYVDRATGRPEFPVVNHPIAEIMALAQHAGLHAERAELMLPLLGWRSTRLHGVAAKLAGATCLLVLKRDHAAC